MSVTSGDRTSTADPFRDDGTAATAAAPSQDLSIPHGAAIAAVDGTFGRLGAGTGLVLIHAGTVHLRGEEMPDGRSSYQAEAMAVARALQLAGSLGVGRLRILLDEVTLALAVQGDPTRRSGLRSRAPWLSRALDAARARGLAVSARVVQGHAETADLPSLLNDLAHHLADAGVSGGYADGVALGPGWHDRLAQAQPRFAASRNPRRWIACLPRLRVAAFLGVGVDVVDRIVRAGHLEIWPEGVTRRSAARAYEVAQELNRDGFFGFGEPEGVDGEWYAEIGRGWDHRVLDALLGPGCKGRAPGAAHDTDHNEPDDESEAAA